MIEQATLPPESVRSLPSLIGGVAAIIEKQLSPGDVAALRRLRPDSPTTAAFWRTLLAATIDEQLGAGPRRDQQEEQWAVVFQAMAEMRGLHAPAIGLGRALVNAGVSEPRFLRLLRAGDHALADAVRIVAHHLAATATPSNHLDLARLVFSEERADREPVRRRIARDFYRALAKETHA